MLLKLRSIITYILYICTEYEDNSALSPETDTTELQGKTIDLQLSEVIFRVNNYTNENFFVDIASFPLI